MALAPLFQQMSLASSLWLVASLALAAGCAPELGAGPDAGAECQGQDCVDDLPPGCGDGVLSAVEECDDGNEDEDDACVRCAIAQCGDGQVFTGTEQCDDANTEDGDGCSANCQFEDCGDGEVQSIEQCEGSAPSTCETSCGSVGSTVCQADSCLFAECTSPQETCNALDDDCDEGVDTSECLVELHRFFNASRADHMYAAGTTPLTGYVLESQSFSVYVEQVPGSVPLYQKRSPNGNNHLLTINQDEANQIGYTLESTLGYVVAAADVSWDVGAAETSLDSTVFCRYFNSAPDHLVDLEGNAANLAGFGYSKEACFFAGWR